jgi:hypothetical protein
MARDEQVPVHVGDDLPEQAVLAGSDEPDDRAGVGDEQRHRCQTVASNDASR